MKKIAVLIIAGLMFYHWESISSVVNPPPDFAKAYDNKVVLYGTSWCGYCAKTRKMLRENHIAYIEYDIEKSLKGKTQYNKLNGNGVPLMLIDGVVVRGYNPSKILKLAKKI